MTNQSLIEEWVKRAKSNLERARAGRASEEILYEDLCFDCQQVAEKSLKALLVHIDVAFPWTHSIAKLIELIEEKGVDVPEEIKESISLTTYAVSTRYPGDYESVDEEEYKETVEIAERVFCWVEKKLEEDKIPLSSYTF